MTPTFEWYQQLIKPFWAPPAWIFSPVWTFLYVVIAITFSWVFWQVWKKRIPGKITWPFALNLFFNLTFTPIQFGLRNNLGASLDVILVLITILWAMKAIYPHKKWLAYVQIPYLLWVSFATILQLTITYLNW